MNTHIDSTFNPITLNCIQTQLVVALWKHLEREFAFWMKFYFTEEEILACTPYHSRQEIKNILKSYFRNFDGRDNPALVLEIDRMGDIPLPA